MPLQYIAGKMVVIRSLVAGLNLLPVTPSGHPLKNLKKAPVFAAMIPMQVYNSLQVPEEKELLKQIKHLIIGGGAIDSALAQALKDFSQSGMVYLRDDRNTFAHRLTQSKRDRSFRMVHPF